MMNSFPLFSDLHQFDNITPYFMADPICRYGSMLYLQLNWAVQQEQLINLTYSCSTCHVLWTALDGMHPFSLSFFLLDWCWDIETLGQWFQSLSLTRRAFSVPLFPPLEAFSSFCCALILDWIFCLIVFFPLYIEVLLSFNCLPHTLFFINLCNQYSILESIHM